MWERLSGRGREVRGVEEAWVVREGVKWEFVSFVGVGPVRFGMTFDEVRVALAEPTSHVPGRWMEFDDLGVSAGPRPDRASRLGPQNTRAGRHRWDADGQYRVAGHSLIADSWFLRLGILRARQRDVGPAADPS